MRNMSVRHILERVLFAQDKKNNEHLYVHNFSRHTFNIDQILTMKEAGYYTDDEVISPFFKDSKDFANQTNGKISSCIMPTIFLLETMTADPEYKANLIFWEVDESARKRHRFAARRMVVFNVEKGKATKIKEAVIEPTVETDYKTGEEFPVMKGEKRKK